MTDPHDESPAPGSDLSRRRLLHGAAGLGAAGAVAGLLAGSAGTAMAGQDPAEPDNDEPVVAHVRDVRTGEIDMFVGTGHVRVHDRALAARLTRAARDAR